MHVAFDARMLHYRRAGGIGQYSLSLLKAFSKAPEVGPEDKISILQMRGDTVPAVADKRFRRVPLLTPAHHCFEQAALGIELLKLRPRPDLIHCPDFIPPQYRRFPAVANIQDLAFLKFPETTLLTPESKRYYGQVCRAARDAEALIALSQSARDDIVSLLGADPARVEVIPAAAGEEFQPPESVSRAQAVAAELFALPRSDEGGYILFVSTIEPRKNLTTLLEAYRLMLDAGRIKHPPVLAVAGREGWLYEKVYGRMRELGLESSVRLLGGVPSDRLVRLYQGARLFALPSLYEGFGLPALEAMQCGVPVLTANTGSLPEVVGGGGVLIEPLDVEAWASALERVLLDPDEEARLRNSGPAQAANFSWARAAAQTWALYRRIGE